MDQPMALWLILVYAVRDADVPNKQILEPMPVNTAILLGPILPDTTPDHNNPSSNLNTSFLYNKTVSFQQCLRFLDVCLLFTHIRSFSTSLKHKELHANNPAAFDPIFSGAKIAGDKHSRCQPKYNNIRQQQHYFVPLFKRLL